jgi:hypothetical protein
MKGPTIFGNKFYPMTLRPAIPYLFGMALYYSLILKIDSAAKNSTNKSDDH